MKRQRGVLLGMGVAAAVAGATPQAASAEERWCAAPTAPPCVESATLNGAPVTASDLTWAIDVSDHSDVESDRFTFGVESRVNDDFLELGAASLDDVWVINFDTGAIVPRVATGRASGSPTTLFTRTDDGDSTYHAAFTGTPVITTQECDQSVLPWTCDEPASDERIGYLDGSVTDYGEWIDVSQRQSMYGINYFTNVSAISSPPDILPDPNSDGNLVSLQMANSHFRVDGVTVFQGYAKVRLPNTFLDEVFDIDDPTSLSTDGLTASVGSGTGTASVTQEPGAQAMLVDVSGLTFSQRRVKIATGDIRPTRPGDVTAARLTEKKGTLDFTESEARGSEIQRYRADCEGPRAEEARGLAESSPITVRPLKPGKRYECKVRAIAIAGKGPAATVTIPRSPN